MRSFDEGILMVLGELARRSGKGYCYPSQVKISELLRRFYGVERSRRSLNRHLRNLEDSGFFVRIRRHRRGTDETMVFRSTLYKLKGKLFKFMGSLLRGAQDFFSVFRVPYSAQYLGTTAKVSIKSGPGGMVPLGSFLRGGPSGISKTASPPPSPEENLSRIRELVRKLGS